MKICFLGAGALGSSLGGVLSEAGLDVWLVDSWHEHVKTLTRHGLRVREGSEERVVKVRAVTECREVGVVDLLIVLVKSYNTHAAIEQADPLLGSETVVLSLQNGLGNEDILEGAVGKSRLIGGRTFTGGVLLAPGYVMAGRKGKQTYIGELDGSVTARVTRIAKVLTQGGIETLVSANIIGMMWDKLLINCATSALTGITGLPYGQLYQVDALRDVGMAAVAEGIAVARACKVDLAVTDPDAIWWKAGAGLPADFKPSMLQDVEKGNRTEIDFINGAVVRVGRQHGVPTPVNETLVALMKGVERHHR